VVDCPLGCEALVTRSSISAHCADECPLRPILCPRGCGVSTAARSLLRHGEQVCPLRPTACPLSALGCCIPSCPGTLPYTELQVHLSSTSILSTGLVQTITQQARLNEELRGTIQEQGRTIQEQGQVIADLRDAALRLSRDESALGKRPLPSPSASASACAPRPSAAPPPPSPAPQEMRHHPGYCVRSHIHLCVSNM
jgi:hypothetical protein